MIGGNVLMIIDVAIKDSPQNITVDHKKK